MAKASRGYFIGERRYTPSRFRRLSHTRQVEGMVEWFGSNYEDPAERTSYVSAEGGYLWNHGGPFDAAEELHAEFGDLGLESAIADATRQIEEDGITEWASAHDEYDDGYEDDGFDEDGNRSLNLPMPDLAFDFPHDEGVASGEVADGDGDEWPPLIDVPAEERELRTKVVASLDKFDAVSNALLAARARRGHNHPPEMVDEFDGLPWGELEAARHAAAELREETGNEEPDISRVASAVQKISNLAGKLGKWLAVVVGSGVIGGAAWDGAKALYANPHALYVAANTLGNAATDWMRYLESFH